MADPGIGHKSYVQIGKEATYGTAVASTIKLPILACDIKLEAPPIPDTLLSGTPWVRTVAQGAKRTMGQLSTHLLFEGMLELLRGAFGRYSNTLFETGVRDHFFEIGATLNGFTIQDPRGDVPATKCFRSTGQKIDKFTLRGTAGQAAESIVAVEFGLVGQDQLSNQTPTSSLNFPAYFPVMFNAAMTTVNDGTADAVADVRVRGFEFTIENMLTDDRWFGSGATIDEPLRGDKMVAKFKFQQEFKTRTQFDAYRALTNGAPRLVFQHPTLIGATGKREFEITAASAYLEEDPRPPVEGPGVLIGTSTWVAFSEGDLLNASPVLCRVRSNEAALA